ncbi:hypothetical protein HBO15_24915 [Pseudomonas sp. WS 5111]|jgi:hypothetical protein|uniref:hypothetical protein n=1 Tax=unclassified Pseudomonas TaxID=196821 RepID=UPI001475D8C4|nr:MULTISPECIES: hypothetical protein [unclassified Pseudomonas]NMX70605.1 hypothetical protein [Pseudomonas sp. WS 5111]NMX87463.1 hypothetical protein [Pseudomonas sp. WS 5010]
MDIRFFTGLGIIQQLLSNQVCNINTNTSQATCPERSTPETLQPPALGDLDSATRPTAATGRPAGDRRTAEQIINANPTLKHLEMRPSIYRRGPEHRPLPDAYKQGIYKHTGDWTIANKDPQARADAAYNAARLFNFIDSKDAHAVLASQHNDGFLSGYSGNEQIVPFKKQHPDEAIYPPFREPSIRKDSEHALLTKFIEHGYASLEFKGEQQIYVRPTHATGRPRGDHRSAEDILRDNPLLATADRIVNALVKSGENLKELQKHIGDWSKNNKDPEARADAAYNLAYIANYIDSLNEPTTNISLKSPAFNHGNVWAHKDTADKSYLLQVTLKDGYELLNSSTAPNETP